VITRDLRRAIARAVAAAGFDRAVDPGLRPTGIPGQYAASVALALGSNPRATAAALAGRLAKADWINTADVTGPGYLTVNITAAALDSVADSVTAAGPGCVTSDALAGMTVAAPPAGDPLATATWKEARSALAAGLTARLAAAAGATVAGLAESERDWLALAASTDRSRGVSRARSDDPGTAPDVKAQRPESEVAAAVAYAGPDAVTFTLARAIPGKPVAVDPRVIARHAPGNPAYAVRYAHARAASGVRWAATSAGKSPASAEAVSGQSSPREMLLDALSWLPERVAAAARRGRPDEFARYLEDLANVTVDVLSSGSDTLAEARAARTGLAAGLGLLGVSAPDRL
jgi:arginyl-tRNA synthetase